MEGEKEERERLEFVRRAVYAAVYSQYANNLKYQSSSSSGGMEGALLDLIEGSLMLVVNSNAESQWAEEEED